KYVRVSSLDLPNLEHQLPDTFAPSVSLDESDGPASRLRKLKVRHARPVRYLTIDAAVGTQRNDVDARFFFGHVVKPDRQLRADAESHGRYERLHVERQTGFT